MSPKVTAYLGTGCNISDKNLKTILGEIVPAALNSNQGPLFPGCIEFFSQEAPYLGPIDVMVDIEACLFEDRERNVEERANSIKDALGELQLIPNGRFAVWLKLLPGAWVSDAPDPIIKVDMSMPAAMERVRELINISLAEQFKEKRSASRCYPH